MDTSTYRKRIHAAFPDLDIQTLETNSEGLVHDVLIVNDERVFRFPKSDYSRQSLQREIRILSLLRPCVTLRVPDYDFVEEDMVSYRVIPGRALLREHLYSTDSTKVMYMVHQIAEFHAQMHGMPITEDIPPSDAQGDRESWLRLYESLQAEAYPLLMLNAREWVDRHFAPVVSGALAIDEYAPALINGDLGPYHVLFDAEQGKVNGIIDFGTAGIGDPATDIALLINTYGETFLRWMAPHYPGLPHLIERARFIAGTLELQWLLGGLRSDDRSWFGVHIGRARDMLPVGSGWRD